MISGNQEYWFGDNEADVLARALEKNIFLAIYQPPEPGKSEGLVCVNAVYISGRDTSSSEGIPVVIVNTGEHWEGGLTAHVIDKIEYPSISKSLQKYTSEGKRNEGG